jgi:hypothetical protein
MYCEFGLLFVLCLRYSSLMLGLAWKYNFLICGMRDWFKKLEYNINPRYSKSCKSEVFKFVLKEWKVAQE